jgi:hypothetical protein
MAGNKDEAQQVVTNIVIESGVEIRHGHLFRRELAAELLVLALEPCTSAKVVDRAMFGRGHKPGSRVVWDARFRPLFERSDESILSEVLGDADVAHNSREAGDEPRRLDPPDRVNRTMGIVSISISHC